ncbi:MAG: hypothetical protein ABDH18_06340 [Aquificaceae bacterium]
MKFYILGVIFLILNIIYSSFALKVAKEHARKVSSLKQEMELRSRLKLEIQSQINYKTARQHALKEKYFSIDWNKVKILELPQD